MVDQPRLPKDVYLYLVEFADDKTILNMLSVNRKFNDPRFFERIMKRRYPLLVPLKDESESWRKFYLDMIYYIAKLNEEYGIPYIPTKDYNPKTFYTLYEYDSKKTRLNEALATAARGGHLNLVKYLQGLGANDINYAFINAAYGGHLELFKYLKDQGANNFSVALQLAGEEGHLDVVNYIKNLTG